MSTLLAAANRVLGLFEKYCLGHISSLMPHTRTMDTNSDLVNQFVNSTIIAMFLIGGWMLSVYITEDISVFGESDDNSWVLTGQDNDNNNDISEGDTATLTTGSLFDEELQRHVALLKIKAFAGYIFIFSGCMLFQRFSNFERGYRMPPEVLEKLKKK